MQEPIGGKSAKAILKGAAKGKRPAVTVDGSGAEGGGPPPPPGLFVSPAEELCAGVETAADFYIDPQLMSPSKSVNLFLEEADVLKSRIESPRSEVPRPRSRIYFPSFSRAVSSAPRGAGAGDGTKSAPDASLASPKHSPASPSRGARKAQNASAGSGVASRRLITSRPSVFLNAIDAAFGASSAGSVVSGSAPTAPATSQAWRLPGLKSRSPKLAAAGYITFDATPELKRPSLPKPTLAGNGDALFAEEGLMGIITKKPADIPNVPADIWAEWEASRFRRSNLERGSVTANNTGNGGRALARPTMSKLDASRSPTGKEDADSFADLDDGASSNGLPAPMATWASSNGLKGIGFKAPRPRAPELEPAMGGVAATAVSRPSAVGPKRASNFNTSTNAVNLNAHLSGFSSSDGMNAVASMQTRSSRVLNGFSSGDLINTSAGMPSRSSMVMGRGSSGGVTNESAGMQSRPSVVLSGFSSDGGMGPLVGMQSRSSRVVGRGSDAGGALGPAMLLVRVPEGGALDPEKNYKNENGDAFVTTLYLSTKGISI